MRTFVACAVAVVILASAAWAQLCNQCAGKAYTKDIGECKECKGITASGQFQLCMKCSRQLKQCEHCRASLTTQPATAASMPASAPAGKLNLSKSGVYKQDRWEYRYTVSNEGTRSEGYTGVLLYDGKEVPQPEINDYYKTPWGNLYWTGLRSVAFGPHGWMPRQLLSHGPGKLLSEPSGS
ncbi:MAG: hypothetical protein ACE15C_01100 [Phycisphaerae bacterium]